MIEEFKPYEDDQPEVAVAASCVHVIAELSRMIQEGFPHDPRSIAMVMGCMAFLNSVMDGKAINPVFIGKNFEGACVAVEQSLLDEVDRAQHYLAEALEKASQAEGRALVAEQYAGWYLRLRDGKTHLLVNNDRWDYTPQSLTGEDLDAAMEDLDEPDPGNDIGAA